MSSHRSGAAAAGPVRVQRLRTSPDVRAVFAAREAAACAGAVVHVRRRAAAGPPRLTVVAGKKIGNAVARNRAKRRLRACVRALALRPGRDYVIMARPAALSAPYPELCSTLHRTIQKLESRSA